MIVWQGLGRVLRAAALSGLLVVGWRDRMGLGVRRRMLLRVMLLVMLMHDARRAGVLLLRLALVRCWTLLLVVGMVLHRERAR